MSDNFDKVVNQIRFFAALDRDENGNRVRENDHEAFEAASEAIKALGKASNGGNKQAILFGLLDGLLHEHRYLQSEVIFTLLKALGIFGQLPTHNVTDARNEAAHATCRRLAEFENLYFGDVL